MATSGQTLTDAIRSFERGINSGLQPSLIPKNQLVFALNSTVRGGLVRNRPPFTRQLTMVWESDAVQLAVQTGLFQGACYYSPDTGPQALIASISGRLFRFTVNGDTVTVSEITIPNDPNPAATTQAWLWQAEQFVIVNDGLSLPIFYDGTSSRRSAGPSVTLAVATATDPGGTATPAIGDTFTLVTVADYPGPYNVPILFHGEYYQAIDASEVYHVTLTSLYDVVGAVHAVNTDIVSQPSVVGYITTPQSFSQIGTRAANTISETIPLSTPFTGPIGSLVSITGTGSFENGKTIIWRVVSKSGNNVTLRNNASLNGTGLVGYNYPVGTVVYNAGSTDPNKVVAELKSTLNYAAPGTETTVVVRDLYTGAEGAIVYIDGAQFSIKFAATTPSVPTPNRVTLMNLTDASGVVITFGTGLDIVSVPELPAGRMGAYGMGQNWECLVDGKSFIVSDISRSASGTQAYDYRDAVLKTTELTFNGGSFAIPSAGVTITSMTFTAKMDESLGQGPLQIGTQTAMFSVNAPFDFANPPPIGTPILPEVLKGQGPLSQDGTILVNSDTFFRATDGYASFIQARRDFTSWGNAGISDEINERLLDNDTQSLLPYGSAIEFDNRFIATLSPQTSAGGVFHTGVAVINLDPVSSLSGKGESVYDGLWTGVNALRLLKGLFSGSNRAFVFSYNVTLSKIELYEILPSKTEAQLDNGIIPITWGFETAGLFNADKKPDEQLIRLQDGEFAVDDVLGTLNVRVWYRFDTGCWTPWHNFTICASGSEPQTHPRLGLGEPSGDVCDPVDNSPAREGYSLQVKFQFTGRGRFLRARFKAVTADSPEFKEPTCNVVECVSQACNPVPPDLETYSLQTDIIFNGVPISAIGTNGETIIYPPETFVIPNPPPGDPPGTIYYVQGCLSSIAYTNDSASIAAMFAELARQQALCDTGGDSGGGGGGGGIVTPPGTHTIELTDLT